MVEQTILILPSVQVFCQSQHLTIKVYFTAETGKKKAIFLMFTCNKNVGK